MTDDMKKCPFCGEEIKAKAIKCKHCGEFLSENTPDVEMKPADVQQKSDTGRNIGIGIACVLLIGFLASFLPEPDTSTYSTDSANSEYSSEPVKEPVTGSHSGFGALGVAFSNLGGQNAHCAEAGAGKSLVKELEDMINTSSPNNNPTLYSISDYNPRLKFEVSNPRWAEDVYNFSKCRADITFKNYKSDTIAGYEGYGASATPYTMDEAQWGVTYYVSELSGKYKVTINAVGSDPIQGYYDN